MMQRLYLELHSKYDAAIKHIEGRVGRTPPRPLPLPAVQAPTAAATSAATATGAVESPSVHNAAAASEAPVRKREL
jgi:hypothetical protein